MTDSDQPQPSTAEDNGRRSDGKFAAGNKFGKGNPHAQRVAQLRSELLSTITPEDIRAVCQSMIESAKGGDVAAAKLLLSYSVGKPETVVSLSVESESKDLDAKLRSMGIKPEEGRAAMDKAIKEALEGCTTHLWLIEQELGPQKEFDKIYMRNQN